MSISLHLKQSRIALQKQPQIVYHILFFSILIFTLYTGLMGTDFRKHWDERKLFKSIRDSIPVGRALPGWYNYPSMIYDLTVLSLSPEILSSYLSDPASFRVSMRKLLVDTELRSITVRARRVFLGIALLSTVWTYLLVFIWTKQWLQALLSSTLLASSWEFAYHARWIAPDAILMQFGVLTLLLVFLALGSSGRQRFVWLIAAAVAAGMACSTKYFGGIFLVPVFLGGYQLLRDAGQKWTGYLAWFLLLAVVFSLTFLLITPGALMDTTRMLQDIQYEINHYRGGDFGYTVSPGWEHLSLLLVYLFGVFFSKYMGISLFLSVFVLVGLYSLFRRNWKSIETWVFLSVPLLFIPYMSLQRVMMVRNDLLLFPFLAVLSARGMFVIWNLGFFQSNRIAKAILVVAVVTALLINFNWLYDSAGTISENLTTDRSQKLQAYLLANQETTYYLSPAARSLIDTNGMPNVVNDPSHADKLVFVFKEVNHALANRPDVYDPIFGPYEVNFDYYPSWLEDERMMVMPMKAALPQKEFNFIYQ
ncbi:MAG: phospholipid carrier-dependent glycosyltransferase [Syntrophothermus sp.]